MLRRPPRSTRTATLFPYTTRFRSDEREEDIDTLGGLLFTLAVRVPDRGDLVEHPPSGITFEVLEADPRRVKRVRVRDATAAAVAAAEDPGRCRRPALSSGALLVGNDCVGPCGSRWSRYQYKKQ